MQLFIPPLKDQVNEIPYYKTRPPLLRDPSESHDQMDNFGRREAERISDKLKPVRAVKTLPRSSGKVGDTHYPDIREIRRPWGW